MPVSGSLNEVNWYAFLFKFRSSSYTDKLCHTLGLRSLAPLPSTEARNLTR